MMISFPWFGREPQATSGPPAWIIVGLGNPGQKYTDTRHNAGWHLLDRLASQYRLHFDEHRNKGLLARGTIEDVRVALVKPQTYMNLSGESVGPIARFYKVPPENVLVVYDELDLPLGRIRIKPKGGAGGHNGMRSIIQHLGTDKFPRMRLGIGRPPGQMPGSAYVLQKFKPDEWEAMQATYIEGVDAIKALLTEGLEYAMNNFNTKS